LGKRDFPDPEEIFIHFDYVASSVTCWEVNWRGWQLSILCYINLVNHLPQIVNWSYLVIVVC